MEPAAAYRARPLLRALPTAIPTCRSNDLKGGTPLEPHSVTLGMIRTDHPQTARTGYGVSTGGSRHYGERRGDPGRLRRVGTRVGHRGHLRSFFAVGVALATVIGFTGAGTAAASTDHAAHTPLRVKVIGTRADGSPKFTASSPTGLSPTTVQTVYGLTPSAGNGSGQTIAIVDAYHDPNALSDLNKFSLQYGLPQCNTANPCFAQLDPQGVPAVNSGWVLEESLDIEWAHAQAPSARILLVEAASASFTNLL